MIITKITFEDHGQDFLEWDVDENGEVIHSRPFQNQVWSGGFIWNEQVNTGDKIIYMSPRSDHPIEIKYPVVAVNTHKKHT